MWDHVGRANLAGVGSMEPEIGIWDVDVVEAVEPVLTLGPTKASAKKKKRKVCLLIQSERQG